MSSKSLERPERTARRAGTWSNVTIEYSAPARLFVAELRVQLRQDGREVVHLLRAMEQERETDPVGKSLGPQSR